MTSLRQVTPIVDVIQRYTVRIASSPKVEHKSRRSGVIVTSLPHFCGTKFDLFKVDSEIRAIIAHLRNSVPLVDVIFLQEVPQPALTTLLAIPWLRDHWYSSEADTINWGTQSFASMMLVSRLRVGDIGRAANKAALGPIWRVKYPSRFERDALCCDILLTSSGSLSRVRFINVHLDSLPIQPSLRFLQLSVVSTYLRAAGRDLVAGDFKSVLPEDDTLISTNCLIDVYAELHPNESGFT